MKEITKEIVEGIIIWRARRIDFTENQFNISLIQLLLFQCSTPVIVHLSTFTFHSSFKEVVIRTEKLQLSNSKAVVSSCKKWKTNSKVLFKYANLKRMLLPWKASDGVPQKCLILVGSCFFKEESNPQINYLIYNLILSKRNHWIEERLIEISLYLFVIGITYVEYIRLRAIW